MFVTVLGLVFCAAAAITLATANSRIVAETRAWLHALQTSVELRNFQMPNGGLGDMVFTGRDRAFDNTLKRMGRISLIGWLLFALGTVLQLIGGLTGNWQ